MRVDDGWSASGLPADFVDPVPDFSSDASSSLTERAAGFPGKDDAATPAASGRSRIAPIIPIVPDQRREPAAPKTQVTAEAARKMLSRNDSPDIPFDVAVNPYRGCEHGCVYCYARPTHAYLGYSPGLDFETRLVARPTPSRPCARN